ncbi:hypothetical protein KFL_000260280 [Klebsormidium nitens]|uniref:Uncharacterized protein n=1 Tax=Klebsormidium nitens TaxID=105231 RepID=A0A1Y1HNA9_KLENI|nr:hypothetical protein KFL_000260280 [Klebsormidium nitens]|eukprot:GAQ79212.1 hypothetical protein KFL_000260280 [Klebsormidium nitens]
MPPFRETSATFQMASAVPWKSEGIAIPASNSLRITRKVEWEAGEEAHEPELEDALSANSSGSSPRRIGDPAVGSLPKRARLACKDRVGKLVISGSVPNQGFMHLARSAPAPVIGAAVSAQFSSSPFARLTLQPGSVSNGASLHRLRGVPAHSVDRTLVSEEGKEPLDREPGYSSKSSDDGFRAGFSVDPDMESDAESSFWPAERMEGVYKPSNGVATEKSLVAVLDQGTELKEEASVDERTDVIGRMSEAASEASFRPSVLYFAVLAMDLCLATMWRPLGQKNVNRARGLGFTCLYLAAAQLGAPIPLEKFCSLSAVQESWVGAPMIRQQQQEVMSLLDVGGQASGLDVGELWGKLVRATGKASEAVYMAEFVSLLAGSEYSVDHFTMDMITFSSDILDASGDTTVKSQAKVLADVLCPEVPCPKPATTEQKDSLSGGFVFGAVLPALKSPSKPHCRAQAGPVTAFKSGSQRLVKWR